MTLALGLLALLGGADLVISGITKRPFGRLVLGYWDAPGSDTPVPTAPVSTAPAVASTGGVHGAQVARNSI